MKRSCVRNLPGPSPYSATHRHIYVYGATYVRLTHSRPTLTLGVTFKQVRADTITIVTAMAQVPIIGARTVSYS